MPPANLIRNLRSVGTFANVPNPRLPAMKQSNSSVFALLVSIWMLVEGGLGLFKPVWLGILTTNQGQAASYVVLGIAGLLARPRANILYRYLCFLGSLLIMVAFFWVLPPTRYLPNDLLNVNWAGALLNLVIGAASLTVAINENSRRRVVPRSAPKSN